MRVLGPDFVPLGSSAGIGRQDNLLHLKRLQPGSLCLRQTRTIICFLNPTFAGSLQSFAMGKFVGRKGKIFTRLVSRGSKKDQVRRIQY